MYPLPAYRLRRAVALLLPSAAALLAPAMPALAQAVIAHAEQPPRLVRKATVLEAPAGMRLAAGDIVESDARPVQLEWPNGARLALGPASSVLVRDATGLPAATLLRGWAKFATTAPAGGQLALDAGALALQARSASGIVHLAPDGTELFIENGTVPVTDRERGAASTPVGSEQYAVRRGAQGLAIAAGAPRPFVGRMPRPFLDPLVTVAAPAPPPEPAAQRDIAAADIARWRDAGMETRKRLAAQFAPRLADAEFRAEAHTLLDTQPEWRDALRRHGAMKSRAAAPLNHLF